MEDISLLLGHIKDLSLRRNYKDILTWLGKHEKDK